MSSGKIEKIQYENLNMTRVSESYNISELVIPFSQLFKKYKSMEIYSGKERIPFKERDPEYIMILQQEFIEF
ncbi:MAG: hypothetical protein ACFFC3_05485 [Candidatus Odinarchaeota archaeon]